MARGPLAPADLLPGEPGGEPDFGAVLGALRHFNLHYHCHVGGGYALADP